MFVKNKTAHDVALSRGNVYGNIGVASLALERTFSIRDGGLEPVDQERTEFDPPDIRRTLLWRGTSVTAFGSVRCPAREPFARAVRIRVGDRVVDLAVYGDRRWDKSAWGGFVQSTPARFESLPLSWDRAFGGRITLAPGFFPGSELPHPGGELAFPDNPDGIGYIVDRNAAQGSPLPNIEDPAALLSEPGDTPTPVGAAPRRQRVRPSRDAEDAAIDDMASILHQTLRTQHHAPTALVFDAPLATGTPIETYGVGDGPLKLSLPPSPITVHLRRGAKRIATRERIRSVHVDADNRTLRVSYAHFERYEITRAPRLVEVEARS